MHSKLIRAAALLLACMMVLLLAACGQPAVESGPLPQSTPVPTQPDSSPVPTVQVPTQTKSPEVTFTAPGTDHVGNIADGDVPALPADEVTELTYTVGEELITSPALRHYTIHGYAITYDTGLFICQEFNEGINYWNSEGNYLSVSMVFGMPMEDMLAGLRLQESIAMEPEPVAIGRGLSALTLYLTTPEGLHRQFWVVEHSGDLLLVEQSYDTVSETAEQYCASQLAMLDTLSLFY